MQELAPCVHTHKTHSIAWGETAARTAGGREETWGHKGSGRAWSQTSAPYTIPAPSVGSPLKDRTSRSLLEVLLSVPWGKGRSGELGVSWELRDRARRSLTRVPFSLASHLGPYFLWKGKQRPATPRTEPGLSLQAAGGGQTQADAPGWHRWPRGSCPPPGSRLPSSLYVLSHPVVSAGALRDGETTETDRKSSGAKTVDLSGASREKKAEDGKLRCD